MNQDANEHPHIDTRSLQFPPVWSNRVRMGRRSSLLHPLDLPSVSNGQHTKQDLLQYVKFIRESSIFRSDALEVGDRLTTIYQARLFNIKSATMAAAMN
jgi:hypothetical protein